LADFRSHSRDCKDGWGAGDCDGIDYDPKSRFFRNIELKESRMATKEDDLYILKRMRG